MQEDKISDFPPNFELANQGIWYYMASSVIHAAAYFGLADLLSDGPKDSDTLAELTDTHPKSMYRLLRTLDTLDIVLEHENKVFSLTQHGKGLRSDHPHAIRNFILFSAGNAQRHAWEYLPECIKTGKSGYELAYGQSFFEYNAKHPDEARRFNLAMEGMNLEEPGVVAQAYDFNQFDSIIDVGGGIGRFLETVLNRHTHPKGVLFDLPEAIAEARSSLRSSPIKNRIEFVTGDFFDEVPRADAYILSHILHDWSDERCVEILNSCRRAMHENSELIIIEAILPPAGERHHSKRIDIGMLVSCGGAERDEQEFRQVLGKAGFTLDQIIQCEMKSQIIVATPDYIETELYSPIRREQDNSISISGAWTRLNNLFRLDTLLKGANLL